MKNYLPEFASLDKFFHLQNSSIANPDLPEKQTTLDPKKYHGRTNKTRWHLTPPPVPN